MPSQEVLDTFDKLNGRPTELGADQRDMLLSSDDMNVRQRAGYQGKVFDYITARAVMDRLDDVVGPSNWSTEYRVIDPNRWAVECRLTIYGVTKADVGYPNNPQADEGQEPEKLKAAYSDAFKRAAVQWGVGRFLYKEDEQAAPVQSSAPYRNQDHTKTTTAPGLATTPPPQQPQRPAIQAGVPGPRPELPATEPQIKAIYAIGRGACSMDEAQVEARSQDLYAARPSELSRRQASEFLDHLKAGAPPPKDSDPVSIASIRDLMVGAPAEGPPGLVPGAVAAGKKNRFGNDIFSIQGFEYTVAQAQGREYLSSVAQCSEPECPSKGKSFNAMPQANPLIFKHGSGAASHALATLDLDAEEL